MGEPTAPRGLGAESGGALRGPYNATAFVDGQGTISLWSPEAESLLGHRAGDVCGTRAVDLLLTPADREAALTAGRWRDGAGQGWDGVLAMRHRDGHAVRVALRVRPVLGGQGQASWLVSAADVRQVEQLEFDQAVLEALFERAPISITVVDTDLRFRALNAVALRDLGLPIEQVIGRRNHEVAPGIDFQVAEECLRRARDTGEPVIDFPVRGRLPTDPEREGLWSSSSFRLTDSAGRVLGMCQTFLDVTEGYRATRRLELLTEAGARMGGTLDVVRAAQELADVAVPGLADVVTVDLLEGTVRGEEPAPGPVGEHVLFRRSGIRSRREGAPEAVYAVGETAVFHPGAPQARCLHSGRSILTKRVDADTESDPRVAEKIHKYHTHSQIVVPLQARGITLGVAVFTRSLDPQPYDEWDLSLAEDLCLRAAVCVDNARRYTREHTTALALQRSLLPHDLPGYPAVETAYRYLPAVAHAGAGGDWFDVLQLSGARVALLVGDVTGHGLHAAAVMGRLRTAVHTLAELDLDPDEVLTHLDDLVVRLTEEDPDCQGASCLYAVYDPASGMCTFARAGHPPPALVRPEGAVEFLDATPPGPPLGLGGQPFETAEYRLPPGSVLALYTDGLIQAPGRDVDEGLDRLARALAGPRPLEQLAEEVMSTLVRQRRSDDVALLLARTRVLAADRVATFELPVDPAMVAQARALTTRQLAKWGLEPLVFTTELIVSELVTNAIRHARGPIVLRLIHSQVLICEVYDGSLSAPHLRRARTTDEGGRGLFLIAQLASRWGSRYTRDGKTIWAEQPLSPTDAPGMPMNEAAGISV
ncbi:SpoIIE family protein phosphatase [Streptomyces hygroscopicus]|uniref:SpoIIE family protein phosphatase n=1 Tax=Streptomyces hygroscopicus TaxID=1912 RepID=UPI0034081D1A